AAQAYRDSLRTALAGNDLAKLEQRATRADARADSLQAEVEKARKSHGIRSFLAGIADDIGVGFGWSAVYFTAFLALWRGQTPGKRLVGVRVILLDGHPLGWWMSFERFGGYAASLSVGLLGFLQILWDRNRQGLHDKACETVVVRVSDAAKPVQPVRRFGTHPPQ
ncbi:MAG TPA: RDD family protein, partial [Longimicrobiales bacterium]